MNNFYAVEGFHLFLPQKYAASWQELLQERVGAPSEKIEVPFPSSLAFQKLGTQVQALWRAFNTDRPNLDKYYMDTAVSLNAYLASFLVPNIERVFQILSSKSAEPALKRLFSSNKTHLKIVDFGSGPLSATVGCLSALEVFFQTHPECVAPRHITLYAVERSDKARELGEKLLKSALAFNIQFEIVPLPSGDKLPAELDLVLCANIFNEIPLKHRQVTANKIAEKLAEKGLLLILEPGQDVHSRNLGSLRDGILQHSVEKINSELAVVAPCLHQRECPLSARSERKDWCWFQSEWTRPELLEKLDFVSKLNHKELNYSFVLFERKRLSVQSALWAARIISLPIPVHNENSEKESFKSFASFARTNLVAGQLESLVSLLQAPTPLGKILLCTSEGALESSFCTESDAVSFQKGDSVTQEMVPLRVREKNKMQNPNSESGI